MTKGRWADGHAEESNRSGPERGRIVGAMSNTPSVGRVVHYVSYGTPGGEFTSECRAAIVTGICPVDDDCSLFVMNPSGVFLNQECPHDEDTKAGGTWHWPERV